MDRKVHLPNGVNIDKMIIGTARFGVTRTEKQCFALLDLYASLGGETIDTAQQYGEKEPGIPVAETIIGKWLKGKRREDFQIISKCACYKVWDPQHTPRVTPEAVHEDMAKALDALGTDYVDVFLFHRDNEAVPVGELVEAMAAEQKAGHTRAYGASNWHIERILEANEYARAHCLPEMVTSEVQFSLAAQNPEDGILMNENVGWLNDREFLIYQANDFPVMGYFGQAKGFMSKLAETEADFYGTPVPLDSMSERERRTLTQFDIPLTRERAKRCNELAIELGYSCAQIALAYVICCGLRASVITGHSKLWQLRENMGVYDIELTPEQVAYLKVN